MQRGQHRQPAVPDQRQQLQLLRDVEVVRRLVQHQHPRFLGQRAGDQHPLLLAAGQAQEGPRGEVGGAGTVQRVLAHPQVGGARPPRTALVRQPPHRDDLGGREPELRRRLLGQRGQVPGPFAYAHGVQVGAVQPYRPGGRAQRAVGTAQQGGLAAAVGPDQPDDPAAVRAQGDVVHEPRAGHVHGHRVDVDPHQAPPPYVPPCPGVRHRIRHRIRHPIRPRLRTCSRAAASAVRRPARRAPR